MSDDPRINDRFPLREGEALSPPVIARPVNECAESVHVSGFVPHATVRVFANGVDLLAEEKPVFGFADLVLSRRVARGETLTATQTVHGVGSAPSSPPVVVSALPEEAIRTVRPVVGAVLYECGRVVPVSSLVPGTRVHVSEDGMEVGVAPTATAGVPVVTQPLHADRMVSAWQVGCEGSGHDVAGLPADPVQVTHAPVPTPPPGVDPVSLIPGNDVVTLTGLLVGAGVEVFDSGVSVFAGGLATAGANWVPLAAPLTGGPVTATQELCGRVSVPSTPVTPRGELTAPVVVGPICDGAGHVLVRGTVLNAVVVVLRNGTPVGYGGAAPGDVVLQLGGGGVLHSGDVVSAVQYLGPVVSPVSNPVTVVRRLRAPAVEILGGHPFFDANAGEQPIDGPVFPRGSGAGVEIRVQTCCSEACRVSVVGPGGQVVAEPELTELFPGYFAATWTWKSTTGWGVPGGVPVGRYEVRARSDCVEQEGTAVFYVIFDPAEVGGPPRFSFDPTAVWFGAVTNGVIGLHYYLHPSDVRVFRPAINAVSGMTDAFAAAAALARLEEGMFTYSLTYHTNDVVKLITGFTDTQCADDACCLVAFLRAVGIPAHPVTADAALETGAANWTFDTWVEFLASDAGVVQWRIFHPHQYPGMAAEPRATFGTTRGVATKQFNDIIVMAADSWVLAELDDGTADVTYGRNACGEPLQALAKAPWIAELCEDGYWATGHWECVGVRSEGLHTETGFRLDDEALRFGGTAAGTVEVRNTETERRFGTLTVQLVGSRVESKSPAEVTYVEHSVRVALEPGESMTVPFRFPLPRTLPPGQDLMLRTLFDQHTTVLRDLRLPVGVQAELDWPSAHRIGEQSVARVTVRNVTPDVVRDVVVDLDPPFALQVEERAQRRLGDLGPGEERQVTWTVRPVAAVSSASVHVGVATADSGSVLIRRPLRVAGPPSTVHVTQTVHRPE